MTWSKDRARAPGELEFHLPSDPETRRHDESWMRQRAERLGHRHGR